MTELRIGTSSVASRALSRVRASPLPCAEPRSIAAGMMVPDAIKLLLDALHQRPVFMAAMSNVPTIFAVRTAASRTQAVAIATITTTGTIGAGVRTRVQD